MRRFAITACRIASSRFGLVLFVIVNAVHAVVHGTPLDGGALDGMIANFDAFAITLILQGEEP